MSHPNTISSISIHDLEAILQRPPPKVELRDITVAHLRWIQQVRWCYVLANGQVDKSPEIQQAIHEEVQKINVLRKKYDDLLKRFVSQSHTH